MHKQNQIQNKAKKGTSKLLITKKKLLKLVFKLPAVGCDKTDSGIEFHSIGAATKNECLIVELTRINIKECDLVDNVLKQKYLKISIAVF